MSTKKRAAIVLGFSAALMMAVPTVASADPGKTSGNSPALQQTTLDDLSTAMHGEAFAYAKYLTFSYVASPQGKTSLSKLFQSTADVELNDHFATEASLASLVGSTEANLKDAVSGEDYEWTSMYPGFADAAYKAGDKAAGDLFSSIAGDEKTHSQNYSDALASLCAHPAGKKGVPAPPTPDTVAIQTGGGSGLSDETRTNLETAMHGEAFAYAKYMLFAGQAQKDGLPAIAQLFRGTAAVELTEHFREEGNLLGLADGDAANLSDAISGETYESTQMYPQFAIDAISAKDYDVASAFLDVRGDEADHAAAYSAALAKLH